jgi:hypothetical protein
MLRRNLLPSSSSEEKAGNFFETPVFSHETTRCHSPEYNSIHFHRLKNKFHRDRKFESTVLMGIIWTQQENGGRLRNKHVHSWY